MQATVVSSPWLNSYYIWSQIFRVLGFKSSLKSVSSFILSHCFQRLLGYFKWFCALEWLSITFVFVLHHNYQRKSILQSDNVFFLPFCFINRIMLLWMWADCLVGRRCTLKSMMVGDHIALFCIKHHNFQILVLFS